MNRLTNGAALLRADGSSAAGAADRLDFDRQMKSFGDVTRTVAELQRLSPGLTRPVTRPHAACHQTTDRDWATGHASHPRGSRDM